MTTTSVLLLLFLCTLAFCCLALALFEAKRTEFDDRWMP
jgi:hypothetical protein